MTSTQVPSATFTGTPLPLASASSTPLAASSSTQTPQPSATSTETPVILGSPTFTVTPGTGFSPVASPAADDGLPEIQDLAVAPNPVINGSVLLLFKFKGRAERFEWSVFSPSMGLVRHQQSPGQAGSCWCQMPFILGSLPNGIWYVRLRAISARGHSTRVVRFYVAR